MSKTTEQAAQWFELPLRQKEFRCPGCGTPWQPSVSRTHAVRMSGPSFMSQPFDRDGWAVCCGNRFRWRGHAPAAAGNQAEGEA